MECAEKNVTMSIVEHDTSCIDDLPRELVFEGVVQFTTRSVFAALPQWFGRDMGKFLSLKPGLYSATTFSPRITKSRNWGYTIAGNTGYGITPGAARILIEDCFENGWQQNDLLMSTKLVPVWHLVPSIIQYDPGRELNTSSKEIFT
jgi:hypothetical protein